MAFVDGGYSGDETNRAAFEASRIRVSVVKRTERKIKGFIVLPHRWIVSARWAGSIAHGAWPRITKV